MAEAQLSRFDSMTNVELRTELKRRGCPTSGNKKDLLAKLHLALQKEYEESIQQASVVINNSVGYAHNEIPVAYANLQATAQHPSVYNLPIPQSVYQSPQPMIPIPQQLTVSSSTGHEQFPSINIPPINTNPIVPLTPEKTTRSRSKKTSVDSRSSEISDTTSSQQLTDNEQIDLDTSTNNNHVEIIPFVSKSNEVEQKDIERVGGSSSLPSVGSTDVESESVIKEIPFSTDEQQRLNQSKSQQINSSVTIDEEQNSAITKTNDDNKNHTDIIDKSSNEDLSADLELAPTNLQDNTKESPMVNEKPAKSASPQQLKPSRSQPSSSSLMKGINKSTNNRINLSSDILKTLITDIRLAPESAFNDELEASISEQNNGDHIEYSSNEPMLETSVDSGFLLSDSMTIGDLADQKQHRNRTVVMDVNVDSSSLNDDHSGVKKKNPMPARVPSYESKILLDGRTNALMMDEPVRIKDATATHEPPSQILYIRGLTRPFTLPLLKELLGRYGTLVDGEFWLDKIKSQCFVTYNTLEDAQTAREALDGCRWPSTNPKTLSVRYGRQDELKFSKTHDLSPDQMSNESTDRVVTEKSNAISSDEIRVNNTKTTREWDVAKLQDETANGSVIPEDQSVKTNEPPAKGLDDYFRKTKAKPAVYWLPLTEEQIIERTRRQEQRKSERDEEQKKRELNENARTTNTKSHRQSPTSKEKRKRSPSPSKNNSKRQ